jgi:hypothetical protein
MIKSKCKLCGSKKGKEILNISDYKDTYLDYMNIDYRGSDRYYKQCDSCGFIYRNTYLTDKEKESLYKCFRDQDLRHETHEEYFERISNMSNDSSENFEKYSFLNSFLESSGSHMDVGGGLGVFCYGFQKYFKEWNSVCVEPTDGANIVAENHGIRTYNQYLTEDTTIVGNNFDLITANHVVEHVDNPVMFLKILKKFVAETGFIYIEMPSSLDIGFLDNSHDRFMCQHEVIYDNKSVDTIAKKAGLKVLYNDNYFSKRGRNNVRSILVK